MSRHRGVQGGRSPHCPTRLFKVCSGLHTVKQRLTVCAAGVRLSDMGNKLVAHFRKVKTGAGFSAVAHHNARLGVYNSEGAILDGTEVPDYIKHPEAARHNWGTGVPAEELHGIRRYEIDAAGLKRKPQKNAAYAIEATFSASPDWFKGKEIKDSAKLFEAYLGWAKGRFGEQNILHTAVHYDETTPHMHLLLLPIVQTKDGAKYSSGEFLGGRQGLREIQTDLADWLKPFGLERGVEGSLARHTNQQQWMSNRELNVEAKAKELADKDAALTKRACSLDDRADELMHREWALDAREIEVAKQVKLMQNREQKLDARERELTQLHKVVLTASQDKVAVERLRDDTKRLIEGSDPKTKGFLVLLNQGFAAVHPDRRGEYIDRIKAVVNEFITVKTPKKDLNSDLGKGR